MKKITLMLLLAVGTACAMAQNTPDTLVVTLDDCRQMALENNAAVRIARGNADAAQEVRKEAFTKYLPTIDASGFAFQSNRHVFQYDVKLPKPLDIDLFNIELIKKGITAGVMAVQPVFAGGQIVNGNRLASVAAEAGELQYAQARDNVALKAEDYYWQLATLKAKRRTLVEFINMADTIEAHVEVALKAGLITRNDLLKVQLQRNALRTLLVDLDNGISLMRQLLAQYIGRDGQSVDIDGYVVPDTVPPYPYDLYVAADQALPNTNDYQLLNKQVKAAELEHRMEVGKNLPTVGIGAGYFYENILRQGHGFGAAFVAVNIPISGWWGGSHAMKKAKIAAENARIQRDDLSQMLQIQMQDKWDDLTAAHRKMQFAHQSIESGAENLRMSQLWYDAGMSTITDLLDAQTLYRTAIDQYTEAYGAFRQATAAYLTATAR